jgi:hypothetical protein
MVRGQAVDLGEARFNGRDHKVSNIFAFDSFGGRDIGHRLAGAAVESEGDADFLAIASGSPGRELFIAFIA